MMAKKASATGKSSGKIKAVSSENDRRGRGSERSRESTDGFASTAADALWKLLESPLVAELLAVGATAAVAALTEHRLANRSGREASGKRALKGAVTAAAGAMGRRIATEFDEIKKAAKAKSAEAV